MHLQYKVLIWYQEILIAGYLIELGHTTSCCLVGNNPRWFSNSKIFFTQDKAIKFLNSKITEERNRLHYKKVLFLKEIKHPIKGNSYSPLQSIEDEIYNFKLFKCQCRESFSNLGKFQTKLTLWDKLKILFARKIWT